MKLLASVKGKELRNILTARIFNGNLIVPKESLPMPKEELNVRCKNINLLYEHGDIPYLKSLLKNQFFNKAIIPVALKLLKHNEDLVDQEIDLCDHFFVSHQQSNDVIDSVFSCAIWSQNENYEAFRVDPAEWLNVAGEIANEVAGPDDDARAFAIWRDFQYQLLYHSNQAMLREANKKFVVYLAHGYLNVNMPNHIRHESAQRGAAILRAGTENPDCLGSVLMTIPAHRQDALKFKPNIFKQHFHVPFSALSFSRHGKRVFEPVSNGDHGMTLFAAYQ